MKYWVEKMDLADPFQTVKINANINKNCFG